MLHHPRIAIVTADLMPASAAKGNGRKTATVQKQQALFALGHAGFNRLRQGV